MQRHISISKLSFAHSHDDEEGEAQKEDVDKYFNLLREKGWYDFVDDFIVPEWNVDGVRIDKNLNYPRTIQVPQIKCENTLNILGQLKTMRELK